MPNLHFRKVEFIKTALKPNGYPVLRDQSGDFLPEIATVGRSNVGKSSLLNHLFRRKNLVKTSSTPGKTQALNFFSTDDELAFVDLPGYGYAKVPKHLRGKWGEMVQAYLEQRTSLKMALFLLDIRRIPNEDDLRFLEWARYYKLPTVLVLTKCDKVKTNEKKNNLKKITEAIGQELPFVTYSVTKNLGRQQLVAMINETLKDA
jgi:GTP-binding protein